MIEQLVKPVLYKAVFYDDMELNGPCDYFVLTSDGWYKIDDIPSLAIRFHGKEFNINHDLVAYFASDDRCGFESRLSRKKGEMK